MGSVSRGADAASIALLPTETYRPSETYRAAVAESAAPEAGAAVAASVPVAAGVAAGVQRASSRRVDLGSLRYASSASRYTHQWVSFHALVGLFLGVLWGGPPESVACNTAIEYEDTYIEV